MAEHHPPRQMILGVFASSGGASSVRGVLRESERRKMIGIVSLALIERDQDGRLELLEARGSSDWMEDTSGSFTAILRLMLGSREPGSFPSRLRELADCFAPGTSAIAALVEHRWVEDIRALMEEAGEETVTEALKSQIAAALNEGRDLVLTAGAADWRSVPPTVFMRG